MTPYAILSDFFSIVLVLIGFIASISLFCLFVSYPVFVSGKSKRKKIKKVKHKTSNISLVYIAIV